MNVRYIILFFVLSSLLLPKSGVAQNIGQIEWSKEYEARGYYKILSAKDGVVLVERKDGEFQNNRRVDIEFSRYDENLKMTNTIEVDNLEDVPYTSIGTIPCNQGLAHIYHMTTKKREQIISAQLYNKDNLNMLDIIDLAKFKAKSKTKERVNQRQDFSFDYPLDIVLSNDKSKLGIYYLQEKVGRDKATNIQYIVLDVENNFSYLYEGQIYTDKESKHYMLEKTHLSNAGKLIFLLKHYKKNKTTEHINKKPAYTYELYYETGDSTAYIYDIKPKKLYMDDLQIATDTEDNVYISGIERKQPFGDGLGTYLLTLDKMGNTIHDIKESYTKREIEDVQGKKDDNIDNDYTTVGIFPSEDIIYIVRQYRRQTSRMDNFNNSINTFGGGINNRGRMTYRWDYNDVIIEGIGKATGERQWLTINPRNMRDTDVFDRYFITGDIEIVDGNLVFLYNERIENMERIRKRDGLKISDIPGDRTSLTIAKVTSSGDISYDQFGVEDRFHIPVDGTHISNGNIYLFNHQRNYRNYYIGKAVLSEVLK